MSAKERDRLRVIEAVRERRLRQGEAAARLGLSVRQVKRLVRAHRAAGAVGLVSKRRGRPSPRRIEEAERVQVLGVCGAECGFRPDAGSGVSRATTASRARWKRCASG
ncbi:MAG: helix-turn-helix domain-containing protein [Burkholderiales bacterium]